MRGSRRSGDAVRDAGWRDLGGCRRGAGVRGSDAVQAGLFAKLRVAAAPEWDPGSSVPFVGRQGGKHCVGTEGRAKDGSTTGMAMRSLRIRLGKYSVVGRERHKVRDARCG